MFAERWAWRVPFHGLSFWVCLVAGVFFERYVENALLWFYWVLVGRW